MNRSVGLPLVFVDTNVVRYTAERMVHQKARAVPGKQTSPGGDARDIMVVTQTRAERAPHSAPSTEIALLKEVVERAVDGALNLCRSQEVRLELLFQPWVIRPFYGKPVQIRQVSSAAEYREDIPRFPSTSGGMLSPGPIAKNWMAYLQQASTTKQVIDLLREYLIRIPDEDSLLGFDFRNLYVSMRATHVLPSNAGEFLAPPLEPLAAPRFRVIQEQLGVMQMALRKRPNAIIDSFLLWTAELAGCTHFLTLDGDVVARHRHSVLTATVPPRLLTELRSA